MVQEKCERLGFLWVIFFNATSYAVGKGIDKVSDTTVPETSLLVAKKREKYSEASLDCGSDRF